MSASPTWVFIHGGMHAGDCWDLTIAELRRRKPDQQVLAVDLPGRGSRPADLATVTLSDWVYAVLDDIEHAGLNEVIIVGHSLSGAVMPLVCARLGRQRTRARVFIASIVPAQGTSVLDAVGGSLGRYARWSARRGRPAVIPATLARLVLCNAMTPAQREFTLQRLYPESPRVITEPVEHGDPAEVTMTTVWVRTTRDRVLRTKIQRRSQAALGASCTEVNIDAGHDVMISHPAVLARILLDVVAASTRPDSVEE